MTSPRERLLMAADIGDLDTVREILAPNFCDENGDTADKPKQPQDPRNKVHVNLRHARCSGRHYNGGVTPLMLACRSGHLKVCMALVQKLGATIHLLDDEDWTALHYASFNGHDQICRFLLDELQKKKNPHTLNENTGNDQIINMAQIMLEQKTKFEKATPIDFARHRKFRNVVDVLGPALTKNDDGTRSDAFWNWSRDEQCDALTKCLRKLQKSKPNHKMQPGLFLFRYEMDLANYEKLENLLQQGIFHAKQEQQIQQQQCGGMYLMDEINDDSSWGDRRIVLDAIDTLLEPLSPNNPYLGDRLSKVSTRSCDNDTSSEFLSSKKKAQKPKKRGGGGGSLTSRSGMTRKNGNGLAVKLIVHLDFEAHTRYKGDIISQQQEQDEPANDQAAATLLEQKLPPQVIRSSSINGMQHLIVLLE